MRNFFVGFCYGIYMIFLGLKRIKLNYLRRFRGEKAALTYIEKVARDWSNFNIKIIGIELNIEGKENIPEEPCLFVANHQSCLDIPVLLYAIGKPIGFIAKKELESVPILRGWMRDVRSVFMDRSNIRESIKSINEGIENLKAGYSMGIFPEGTRSRSSKVGEFKKGSLKLATKSEVPIVPITIDGTYKALEETGKVKRSKVDIVINKPIATKGLSKEEQNDLSEKVRDIISKSIRTV